MPRSLFPLLLFGVSASACMVVASGRMPLLEWKIELVKSAFPDSYQVDIAPSPLLTELWSESSLDNPYFVFRNIKVVDEGLTCTNEEDFGLMVTRSPQDRQKENLVMGISLGTNWLFGLGVVGVFTAWFYIWWVELAVARQPFSEAVLTASGGLVGVVLFVIFLADLKPSLAVDFIDVVQVPTICHGSLILHASLMHIHYETFAVLLLSLLAQLGAVGLMGRQILLSVFHRQTSTRPSVKF